MPSPEIRRYASRDWLAVCRVFEPAARLELERTGTDPAAFRPLPDEEDRTAFERLNTSLVACVDGEVVGFVGWRDRGEWRGSGYLAWLYVDPAHHRRGIGNALLFRAMTALGDQAWTLVKDGNTPAIELYQRHGMRFVASWPDEAWGVPFVHVRLALPTSRKADPAVPSFGA